MTAVTEIRTDTKYDYRIFLLILLGLSLFMVLWFGPLSEYSGHDYYFNIGRFNALMQALREGNYPVYLDYNTLEGYGYFTKGFYPDLVILPFAAIGLIAGAVPAYNIMIFTMTFLCGLFMYFAINNVFRNSFMASVGAILYTFSAYHLFDWYNRAALGESISFTFLPIVFLGLYHIIAGDYKKWYLLTIAFSLLIYTHLLSSVLASIVLVIILLICYKPLLKEPKRIAYLLLAAVVTMPIAGSYLFTMLEQMASNTFYYSEHENITGQTKSGLSELGWGMLSGILFPKSSNMCGTGPLLILLVLLRLFIKQKSQSLRIADICALTGAILLIMISAIFPWGRLPLGFIQFPWRLYEFVVFFFSIAGSYYLYMILKSKKQYIIAGLSIIIFTVVVMVISNENYKYWQTLAKNAVPEWFTGVPSIKNEYYLGRLEYLPVKVPSYNFIHERGDNVKAKLADTEISNYENKDGAIDFDVVVGNTDMLELPLIYYKGYKTTVDTKELPVSESESGLVQISVGKSGSVKVHYAGTTVQRISWYISLLSILGFCLYICFYKKKKQKDEVD